jgi:GNAT superfamily N-acetyltransferase
MTSEGCRIDVQPAAAASWPAIVALFGARGACGGCWCMWWRKPSAQFERDKGDVNRAEFRALVDAGDAPGLLGYHQGEPVGWIAVAPRTVYPRAARSQVARPVTDEPGAWLISCLFVRRDHRGHGHAVTLVRQAAEWAGRCGAAVVQAIPTEPGARQADVFVWTGVASTFAAAGFTEVARNRPSRPLMELRTGQAIGPRQT